MIWLLPYLLSALGGAIPAAWLARLWMQSRVDVARENVADLQEELDKTRLQRDAVSAELAASKDEVRRLTLAGGETLAELRAARRTIEERSGPGEARADLQAAFK